MRLGYLVSVLVLFFIISCADGPMARPAWTSVDANTGLLGGISNPYSGINSSGSALLSITGVSCRESMPPQYQIDVSWLTVFNDIDSLIVEYGAVSRFADAVLEDPYVTDDLASGDGVGNATLLIPVADVGEVGDRILARLVVRSSGRSEYASPVDVYGVESLCGKN